MKEAVAFLERARFAEEERAKIYWNNAQRVFRFP
jgi:hypothetical protein